MTENPQIFEEDYYSRIFETEESHWWARGMRIAMDNLLRNALPNRPLRVLDVGCGSGYLMDYIAKHYALEMDVVGIDISPFALEHCQARHQDLVALADATRVPFADGTFDLIISIDVIQHISDDAEALQRYWKLLRPDGVLYLRTNSALGHVQLEGIDPGMYRRYRLQDVIPMLQDAGFRMHRATYLNGLFGLWGMLKEFVLLKRQNRQAKPIGPGLAIRNYSPSMAWLNQMLFFIYAAEVSFFTRLGLRLPFGHSTAFVAKK